VDLPKGFALRAIYSINKRGFEERYWLRELAYKNGRDEIIPFNHGEFVSPERVMRAQLLDDLYFARDPNLLALYREVERLIAATGADCLIVDNVLPYHPEFLRTLDVYKVMRISDGPMSSYDRDFPYLHAYDHVLYHSPAYSADLGMAEKLRYVGAKQIDFWPLALFDQMFDPSKSEDQLLTQHRDIDVIFVGTMFRNKMPALAKLKKALGSRLMLRGLSPLKSNLYFNLKFGVPGWVRPIPYDQYVPLYQRAKIGINVHNRGKYTVGGYRMFDLPGNGVMQICDGDEYLSAFFREGEEVVGYRSADDLIDKVRYYLDHDAERERIARNGHRRVMADHRIGKRLDDLAGIVNQALGTRAKMA
jgi:spore maturation protein CgeB